MTNAVFRGFTIKAAYWDTKHYTIYHLYNIVLKLNFNLNLTIRV